MANVLFVVHGMGNHAAGWETEIASKLEEVAGRYEHFAADPKALWQSVELVPVSYDDVLSQVLAQWKDAAGGVVAFAEANKLPQIGALDWLAPLAKQDPEFFWQSVSDVLIYRLFGTYRAAIRARVARQIVDKVMSLPDRSFDRCTVLAHSLGTSVAHDTLHLLGRTSFAGYANPFSPPNCRFRAVFTLANVSRLLQDDVKPYESIVRGGPRNSTLSNCSRFYNFRHEWDPICIPKPFEPEGWPDQFNRFRTLSHFRDWDVHGFAHYLDNPRVHVPLLNTLCGEDVISADERDATLNDYEPLGGKLKEALELRDDLRRIGGALERLNENSDLATLIGVTREVRATFAGMRQRVEQLKQDLGV